jgi:hypothetical protein
VLISPEGDKMKYVLWMSFPEHIQTMNRVWGPIARHEDGKSLQCNSPENIWRFQIGGLTSDELVQQYDCISRHVLQSRGNLWWMWSITH